MLFNSFQFLVFFTIVTTLYFVLPHKYRWFQLLVASCVFYMAAIPVYILILFFTIVVDYFAGILIENADEDRKKPFLIMSLVANIGILAFFKYYNFFIDNVNEVLHLANSTRYLPVLHILLPIGLSFHTFQAMSYTIEVYWGNQKAERHFGIYALYVMFYPQLVAGPIERPQNILHAFHEEHKFDYDNMVKGLRLMMWGLIKKVVIADRLLLVTDPIFDAPTQYSGVTLFLACFFFIFQIYCDFSGYSDIALGAAKTMGFDLMKNFNRPYTSKSLSEFWRRWHISLSTWFFDYLFTPVAASLRRWRQGAVVVGLALTFLLSGLWHGASWNFILWGAALGAGLIFELLTKNFRDKAFARIPKNIVGGMGRLCTVFYLILMAVFFRSKTVADSMFFYKKFLGIPGEIGRVIKTHKFGFLNLPNVYHLVIPGFLVIVLLELLEHFGEKYDLANTFQTKKPVFRWAAYYAGLILLMYFGVYEKHQFIYFQF